MTMPTDIADAPREWLRLLSLGKQAAKRGDAAAAHEYFRRAIELDPYYEQVWLWLASVVESDADRRVCFENVLQLNPDHPTARHQLRQLQQDGGLPVALETSASRHPARTRLLIRVIVFALIAVAALVALMAWGVI